MSAPVGTDDVVAAAAGHLLAQPAVVARVGRWSSGEPLIEQDTAPPREEMVSAAAVVLVHAGPVATAGEHTDYAVRLQVELWVDPQRDAGGSVTEPGEARRRLFACWQAVDRVLHRPGAGVQRWGDVRVQYCERSAGLTSYQVPNADGLWRGTAFYTVGVA